LFQVEQIVMENKTESLSFGWTKKQKVEPKKRFVFSQNEQTDDNPINNKESLTKEEKEARSKRLKDEGIALAESLQYRNALAKWDEAIEYQETATLYEMKAQILLELQEPFPAVKAAEIAIRLEPQWAEGFLTLGRAQLHLGEVELAVGSLETGAKLNKEMEGLQEELNIARTLLLKQKKSGTVQHRITVIDETEE